MDKKYEYMAHVWGGAFNEGSAVQHLKGYHYFDTKEEREVFVSNLERYKDLGLAGDFKEGYFTHKRTVAFIKFQYKDKIYNIQYDFGYEYPEDSANFMFFEGNYSCDCNKSLFIQRQCDDNFEEMLCGDKIEIIDFKIKYLD